MVSRAFLPSQTQPSARTHRGGRVAELDALRGIAATGAMLYHYTTAYDREWGHSRDLLFSLSCGDLGVPLFFMISGFVILLTLDRTKTVLDFAVARFCRLFPAYWAAVGMTFVFSLAFGPSDMRRSFSTAIINLTMLQGFFHVPNVDGAYWTLHVELCFYVLAGLLVALRLRQCVISICTLLVVAGGLMTASGVVSGHAYFERYFLLNYMHLFLIGIILYEMRSGWRWIHFVLLAVCVSAAKAHGSWLHPVSIFVLSGIMFVATQRGTALLTGRICLFMGKISYPLYLIHAYIGYVMIRWGYAHGVNPNVCIGFAILFSLGLASGLSLLIEWPANSWLRRKYMSLKERDPVATQNATSTIAGSSSEALE
jgi:peptidoglycan/LPS O-acetylase OafA/YrhL